MGRKLTDKEIRLSFIFEDIKLACLTAKYITEMEIDEIIGYQEDLYNIQSALLQRASVNREMMKRVKS